jgi:ubiquinol-cytochrome c reductase cytochrome c subunit
VWKSTQLKSEEVLLRRFQHACGHTVLLAFLACVAFGQPAPVPPPAAPPPAATPKVDPYAAEFIRLCAGCHTIGGGVLTGPDLATAAKWPEPDRQVAVKRMEKNVGPLTPAEVQGLSALIASPDVQAKLQAAKQARVEEMAATLEPGDPKTGRALFFGEQRLASGGVGCYSCHAFNGRGGNMARDLTTVYARLGEQSVLSSAQQPAFPMMKAAYTGKPVTAQEAVHLVAFFKSTPAGVAAAPPATDGLVVVHAGAGVIVLLAAVVIVLAARARRGGVRARMVRDASRR